MVNTDTTTNTRNRLLLAAEAVFIQHGYEAMSLRQITGRADANMAAVNYHFGGKALLMQEVLARRLDQLNHERLHLLTCCEAEKNGQPLTATSVLSILFVPALRLSRPPLGDPSFMRLLGRVYSDPSPLIRAFLREHYRPISERFFEAFSRALPDLPRSDLSMRLRFSLQSLSGVLAAEGMGELVGALGMGQTISESVLLARLIALVLPMLTVPLGSPDQIREVQRVVDVADVETKTAKVDAPRAPSVDSQGRAAPRNSALRNTSPRGSSAAQWNSNGQHRVP